MTKTILTRTVWLLAIVSLFTDMASEMLYPVMPLYLESIGFSIVLIGVLEGVAEATAGFSKGYFGKWSDSANHRAPFVQFGYLLSALSKPLMAVWTWTWWVFFARTTDRLGKGIRTAARDALLAEEATPETKGRVFGFHRGMDTLGAAIGPALALLFLYFYPEDYRTLFLIALLPGLLAVSASFLIKEKNDKKTNPKAGPGSFFSFLQYIPESSRDYKRLLAGLLAFTVINSSDVFLLLALKHHGLQDTTLIGIYIFYNLVYALAAFPAGILADRWGMHPLFILGLLFFAFVYLGIASAQEWYVFAGLFFLYGLYAACTEGVAKAWISKVVAKDKLATAIGTYESLKSIAALIASAMAGLVWYQLGSHVLFVATAVAVLGIAAYFSLIRFSKSPSEVA